MSGVAEIDAALCGALVAAVLQTDDGVAGAKLLFAEMTQVLISFFRPDAGFVEFSHLKKNKILLLILLL